MISASSPSAVDPAAAHAVRGGIVSRRRLISRLATAARVTQVSAPAGSGKTFLLRSWMNEPGMADAVAWVPVQGPERDPQWFWLSVLDALRATAAGSALLRPLTAAPDLDGWAIAEHLLAGLGGLTSPLWLVVDDAHELRATQTARQLELLMTRAPRELRFVFATRHELRLGLHRLRLEGELTEIRAADLRFTVEEARTLLLAAGVRLTDSALASLHARTEGWAAGLRLAALSLARHPDPERFAREFSGSERTVSEYLLAEVLERQSEEVWRLLLRTSVLDRVSGPLADLLAGGPGGERILQDLEEAGAFVVSLDGRRSWFRYHRLFADLLRQQLRRTEPDRLPALHRAAAGWLAEHGYPVEAVRHAQAARDWALAARVLSDHFLGLVLDGQGATARELLARFPAEVAAADPQLAVLMGADELLGRSLAAAARHLDRAEAPVTLGTAELWALRADEASRHLDRGVALSRRIGRPWLEVSGLAHGAWAASFRSFALAAERSARAIELAREHSGDDEPGVAVAYAALGAIRVWQLRLEEADSLLARAERALRAEALVRLGEYERAESCLAESRDTGRGEMRNARAVLCLARDNPREAAAGQAPAPPRGYAVPSEGEARVLRFLPTNLTAPEIARELSLSVNTVRTHMRHLYEKLGAHGRTEAVERARVAGLLTPSPRRSLPGRPPRLRGDHAAFPATGAARRDSTSNKPAMSRWP